MNRDNVFVAVLSQVKEVRITTNGFYIELYPSGQQYRPVYKLDDYHFQDLKSEKIYTHLYKIQENEEFAVTGLIPAKEFIKVPKYVPKRAFVKRLESRVQKLN